MDKLSHKIHIDNEEEIVRKIVQGETTLFELLVRRYNAVLYKIGKTYGFNHHDTEDLVQETHISAFYGLKNFEGLSTYKAWVSKIMIHKCLYKLNQSTHRNVVFTKELSDKAEMPHYTRHKDPEHKIQNQELAKILETSIQALPLAYRTVFVLREMEGFSVAETYFGLYRQHRFDHEAATLSQTSTS